ncbi:MAG: BAPKO_0422 family outer member beta-barrel protein [Spirochaetaceae bacterium]
MNRRMCSLLLLVLLCLAATPAFADAEGDVGVGFILGDPTGFSMVIADRIALGIGWALADHLQVNTDVWVIDRTLENDVDWHVGFGGAVKVFNEDSNLTPTQEREDADLAVGIRFPVTIQYLLTQRLELHGEASPGVEVYPGFDLDVDVGLGLRYRL